MIVVTLFLGGWSIPWLSTHRLIGSLTGTFGVGAGTGLCLILHVVSFFVKVIVMIWLQMQIRWTLPRFRYDQVMDLCWKIMLPLSLANAFVTGLVILVFQRFSR